VVLKVGIWELTLMHIKQVVGYFPKNKIKIKLIIEEYCFYNEIDKGGNWVTNSGSTFWECPQLMCLNPL
jgi:hypothetical protein